MTDFFERQIALLEAMRAELPELEQLVAQDAESAVTDFHRSREYALSVLAREYDLLRREWNDTEHLTPEERRRVQTLSARAQEAIAEVQPLVSRSIESAREKLGTLEGSMTELRKGRQVMRAYKTRETGPGGGLDRQG